MQLIYKRTINNSSDLVLCQNMNAIKPECSTVRLKDKCASFSSSGRKMLKCGKIHSSTTCRCHVRWVVAQGYGLPGIWNALGT